MHHRNVSHDIKDLGVLEPYFEALMVPVKNCVMQALHINSARLPSSRFHKARGLRGMPPRLGVFLCLCLCLCLSVHMLASFVCLFFCLPVHLAVSLYMCLTVYHFALHALNFKKEHTLEATELCTHTP